MYENAVISWRPDKGVDPGRRESMLVFNGVGYLSEFSKPSFDK